MVSILTGSGALPALAHAATLISFTRSFCMRSAHELGQLPFEGRVAKARPRRAPERMLLEKAFWSTRYATRVGYFRYGPADRCDPSTVWMRSADPAARCGADKVVKICDVKQRLKSEPFVRLMPPSVGSLEPEPAAGCSREYLYVLRRLAGRGLTFPIATVRYGPLKVTAYIMSLLI